MTLTDPRNRHNLEVTELAFGYYEGITLSFRGDAKGPAFWPAR
jgi:hypothetical protein